MSAGIGHQSAEQQEDNGASSLNIGGGSQSYDVKKAQVNGMLGKIAHVARLLT